MQNLIPWIGAFFFCCGWPMLVALGFHAFMTRGIHIDVQPRAVSRSLNWPHRKSNSGRVAAATSRGLRGEE